jgi:spore germination protein YaaH
MYVMQITKTIMFSSFAAFLVSCWYLLNNLSVWYTPLSSLQKGISEEDKISQNTNVLPNQTLPQDTYSAWLPWWDWTKATQSLEAQSLITIVSPFTYIIQPDTSILQKRAIPPSWSEKYTVIPTISHDLDPQIMIKILTNPDIEKFYLTQLEQLVANPLYDGIELDYENIPSQYREQLTAHVRNVATLVKQQNKKIYLALHAKTNDIIAYAGVGSLDYPALCAVVDNCRIMAYDAHYSGSRPGSLVPQYWLAEVLDYSLKHIPTHKLTLALPLYGYLWTDGANGRSLTQSQIFQLSGTQQWDELAISPFIQVNENQIAYYENAYSLRQKIQYAKSRGVHQFSFWRLGDEQQILNDLKP